MDGWPIPLWGTLVTYLGLTAIIILRYFLIVGPIHYGLWVRRPRNAHRLSRRDPTRDTIRNEIRLSVISAFIYALPAAIVLEMWKAGGTAIYGGLPDSPGAWLYLPLSAVIYLFVQDTWFYFTHRAMHHPALFKHTHAGHHRSVQPTPWASFSFDPIEAVSSADMQRFFTHLEQVMLDTGFLDPDNPRLLRRRLHRYFERNRPELSELSILRGLLSAMQRHLPARQTGENP